MFQTHFLWPLLYVSDVKISQTLLTPEGVQILLLFIIAPLSVTNFLKIWWQVSISGFPSKLGFILGKTTSTLKNCSGANFSFQVDIYWYFWENKIRWGIASHKAFIYWFSDEVDDFVQKSENWHFLHFLIDGPVQCYCEAAILKKHFSNKVLWVK